MDVVNEPETICDMLINMDKFDPFLFCLLTSTNATEVEFIPDASTVENPVVLLLRTVAAADGLEMLRVIGETFSTLDKFDPFAFGPGPSMDVL